jgi:pimeloyl-ACP methyl ester carboxylesterase
LPPIVYSAASEWKEAAMAEPPRPVQEQDVTLSNGLTIHYYEWPGPRPNLVLLHPSSGYGRMWEWTANALGGRFHVYALDQRGHGDSGRPDGDYSAEEYAHDLFLFFRAVGLDRAIIAGQSLGGRVGQVFAAMHPEHVQALALVGGPHPSNFFPTRQAAINVLGAAQRMLVSPTEFPSREAALEYLRTSRPRDREPALRHRLEHNLIPSDNGLAVKYDSVRVALGLAHMADDLRKYAAKATCPVAIVRGSKSSELTLDEAKAIAGCWKNAVVIEVDGDYALQMENPVGLAQALLSFAGA